jgi:hypothetical protein
MFWLYLLLRPRHHHHHVRAARKHARFYSVWYWITGLAFMELMLWLVAFEVAGELLGMWWLLWWAARGLAAAGQAMWAVTQPDGVREPDWQRAVDGARPPWPRRQAAKAVAA